MAKPNFTEQLNAFLQQQPPEQVAQWLADTVLADKQLKKQWQIKLLLASGKPSDYKKLLTQALPKKEMSHMPNLWRKVGMYFDEAEALFAMAFEQLEQADCLSSPSLTNEQQFTWLMQAFERLNLVLDTIDDSGGYRLNLVEQLSERLVQCFHQLGWSLEQKANWLHEHQFKYDVFPYIPEQFNLPTELLSAFTNQAGQSNPVSQQSQALFQANKPDNVSMALLETLKRESEK